MRRLIKIYTVFKTLFVYKAEKFSVVSSTGDKGRLQTASITASIKAIAARFYNRHLLSK